MIFKDYEIQAYNPAHYIQVIELLKYLLGGDQNNNRNYFNWKYGTNPITEFPLGIVALHEGKVVGFRGYCPLRFQIKEKNDKIISLVPGDTCVHPDHRRKGLSVAMGNKAADEYTGKYYFFLNLTATRNSLPGYLKMGFYPLTLKSYLSKYNMVGLVRYLYFTKRQYKGVTQKIRYETFNDIIVSQQSRPEEMHYLRESEKTNDNKLILYQDENFLRWRFSNKRDQYIFLYCIENKSLNGYIVFRLSKNKQRGFIIDYAGEEKIIEKIMRFIIKAGFFDILSVYHFNLLDNIKHKVQELGFEEENLFRLIERKINGELPLLIRPVKKNYTDNDFFVEGLDLRKTENWYFKGISYDDI